MMKKQKHVSQYWLKDEAHEGMLANPDFWNFDDFDSLQKFTGTHPSVMLDRIQRQNWKVELDISRKKFSFKEKVLYQFEKMTGVRLFDFRNYRLLK